jgi:F0F1-type ATP synthase delta subunit
MKSRKGQEQGHNPRLKAAFLQVVANQLRANDPPEVRDTLDHLVSQGISAQDAKIYIAQAVCVEIYDTLKNKKPFNRERYLKNLKRLPKEPLE